MIANYSQIDDLPAVKRRVLTPKVGFVREVLQEGHNAPREGPGRRQAAPSAPSTWLKPDMSLATPEVPRRRKIGIGRMVLVSMIMIVVLSAKALLKATMMIGTAIAPR